MPTGIPSKQLNAATQPTALPLTFTSSIADWLILLPIIVYSLILAK